MLRFFPHVSGFGHYHVSDDKFFNACFTVNEYLFQQDPAPVLLEGYLCPRVALVQKATVQVPQLVQISQNLDQVPQTAPDYHHQLQTLSSPSQLIRNRKQHLVFKTYRWVVLDQQGVGGNPRGGIQTQNCSIVSSPGMQEIAFLVSSMGLRRFSSCS